MEQNYRGDFMKNCKHCGAQLADDDTYCYFCGNPLEENNESVENVELVDDDKLLEINGFAKAGLILAFFIPLAGIIFSIIGLKKAPLFRHQCKGMAIAGIIVSIANWILSFIIVFMYMYMYE